MLIYETTERRDSKKWTFVLNYHRQLCPALLTSVHTAAHVRFPSLTDGGPTHKLKVILHFDISMYPTGEIILADRDAYHLHPELRGKIKPAAESFFRDLDGIVRINLVETGRARK